MLVVQNPHDSRLGVGNKSPNQVQAPSNISVKQNKSENNLESIPNVQDVQEVRHLTGGICRLRITILNTQYL